MSVSGLVDRWPDVAAEIRRIRGKVMTFYLTRSCRGIFVRARAEGDDGSVGHLAQEIEGDFFGLSRADLDAAVPCQVEVGEDGMARIVEADEASAVTATKGSDEFFSIDENGNRSDAALHNAMLEGVDEEFERFEIAEARRSALERGVSLATVDAMYPEPKPLVASRPRSPRS